MKKIISLLLVAAMMLSLCACGSGSKQSTSKSLDEYSEEELLAALERLAGENENAAADTEPTKKIYNIGDTVLTPDGLFEVTLNTACFTDEIDLERHVPFNEDSSEWARKWGRFTPADGKTFLYLNATVKLVGDLKKNTTVSIQPYAEYEGVEFRIHHVHAGDDSSSAYFEPFMEYEPVEFSMYGEVPQKVETDVENPLLVTLDVRGDCDYTFRIR